MDDQQACYPVLFPVFSCIMLPFPTQINTPAAAGPTGSYHTGNSADNTTDEVLDEIAEIARAAPEITDRFRELAAAHDESLQLHCIYTELASFVSDVVGTERACHDILERCFSLLEDRARRTPSEREEIVEWAFLGCLPPEVLSYITPRLGPITRTLLQSPETEVLGPQAPGPQTSAASTRGL
jgi:hypothetical protein